MSDTATDPRVSPFGGDGWEVSTSQGVYRVLNSGLMGWGVYTGQNLDLVFTDSGPAIGAENADDLIRALLDNDTPAAQAAASDQQDQTDDDTDGM